MLRGPPRTPEDPGTAAPRVRWDSRQTELAGAPRAALVRVRARRGRQEGAASLPLYMFIFKFCPARTPL